MHTKPTTLEFCEIDKLADLCNTAGIKHRIQPLYDGLQLIAYYGNKQIDDVVIHGFSHGAEEGLLESYYINDCAGYRTAMEVAKAWETLIDHYKFYNEWNYSILENWERG